MFPLAIAPLMHPRLGRDHHRSAHASPTESGPCNYRRDDFLTHYHQRSNVESTVMMIKTKFGDGLKSKSDVAGRNEVLCKALCHNVCCLISAMYELGIQPMF